MDQTESIVVLAESEVTFQRSFRSSIYQFLRFLATISPMTKSTQTALILSVGSVLFLKSAPSTQAFQAVLLPDQSLKVTHGQVLGKDDQNSGNGSAQKAMSPEEYKKYEAEYIKAKGITAEQIKARDEKVAAEKAKSLKNGVTPALPSQSVVDKKIRISVENNKGKLEVLDRDKVGSLSGKPKQPVLKPKVEDDDHGDEFEDSFVKLELLNAANRPQGNSDDGQTRSSLQNRQGENRGSDDRNKPEDNGRPDDNNVTIQTPPSQDIPTQLEIESRQTRSLIEAGSNVTVDPRTNEITVSDKRGEDRTLQRLPDQAFEDLTAKGVVFPDRYDEAKANLIIQTKEDGSVVYHTEITDDRKLFGFIPFKVKVAHEVNDQTGEVTTQDIQDTSFFGRFRTLIGQ